MIVFKKLHRRLMHQAGRAISDFGMIHDGDRIMVCLSGGKDSFTLLDILCALQKKAPVDFELVAVCLDQNFPGFPAEGIAQYVAQTGVPFTLIREDVKGIIESVIPGDTPSCSLCARLRRGILYTTAHRLGLNKVALGHHRDDAIETLFLNLFYSGTLKAIPPKYLTDSRQLMVIRPLYAVRARDIRQYAAARKYPLTPRDLCGQRQSEKRRMVKAMLADWEQSDPGRLDVVFSSLGRLHPRFLADKDHFPFLDLEERCRGVGDRGEAVRDERRSEGEASSDEPHP